MAFYEPTFLFRQNAIRRVGSAHTEEPSSNTSISNSPTSGTSASSGKSSNSSKSNWLMSLDNGSDASIMNKVCSLDRTNIQSNYWKVPDSNMHLTSLAVSSLQSDSPLLAISSASSQNNLFIYQLDTLNQYLTHHTTISLPDIHGLAWVPNTNSKFMVSGNNKGYAHLISVPRPACYGDSGEDESAEIIKRFNHRKHLKLVNKDPSIFSHTSTCISQLSFIADDKLATIYDDTLFVWNINDAESCVRPRPDSISVVPGLAGFDQCGSNTSTLALCGSFGVSLFDTRNSQHSVPKSSIYRTHSNKSIGTNMVKWHSSNEHILASAHGDGSVRLWDIRKQDTFAELTGHRDKTVTSMSWNDNDLFTGASDGNVVYWDLSSDKDADTELSSLGASIRHCSLKEGFNSVNFDKTTNTLVEKLNERQCGTLLPASNNKIIGMCPLTGSGPSRDCKILSVDGSAFLGLHSKIQEAASSTDSEKRFYTSEDINLLRQEASTATLVDAKEQDFVEPLKFHKEQESSDASVSIAESEEFEFMPRSQVQDWDTKSVETLHSIDSLPELNNSPFDSSSRNDSEASLSTLTSFMGTKQNGHSLIPMAKEPSMTFLDLELERLCDRFPSSLA